MVSLIVAALASADPGQVRVAVSVGRLLAPTSSTAEPALGSDALPALAEGPLAWRMARVEVGGGRRVQVVGVGQLSLHNADPLFSAELGSPFAGDYYLAQIGAGVRFPFVTGPVILSPRATAGAAIVHSPIADAALESEVKSENPLAASTRYGGYGELGLDLGVPILQGPVAFELSLDAGYASLQDVGITLGLRVGLGVRI